MIQTILGAKSEMRNVFNKLGHSIPVTTIVAEPNVVVGMRKDRVILGLGKKKRAKKTENAYVKVAGYSPKFVKEVTMRKHSIEKSPQAPEAISQQNQIKEPQINLGDKVTVSIFESGDKVKVTGTTKGRGFAGVVKRWGFAGGPKTHGQSDRHRAPGSIGAGTTPGRVYKGKKMAGHMGNARLTVTGLEVIEVDEGKNILLVKGAVPGPKNGLLIVEKTGKVAKKPATAESTEKKSEDTEKSSQTNDKSQTASSVVAKEEENAKK